MRIRPRVGGVHGPVATEQAEWDDSWVYRLALWMLCGASAIVGCSKMSRQKFAESPAAREELDDRAPFLKVHTRGGNVHVLEDWVLDDRSRVVRGEGVSYDARRKLQQSGRISVAYDDVALLETNDPRHVVHSGLVVMGIATGASLIGTGLCAAQPKACFGSCPTFYLADDPGAGIQAEGFSASIARSLEATDVDALASAPITERELTLVMRNEALETHIVRELALLSVPHVDGTEILRAGSVFLRARGAVAADACHSAFSECRESLSGVDGIEYRSPASSRDLAKQEVIELSFPPVGASAGLRIRGRNSLLNTFLFYQALAYLGHSAGERFAALDASDTDDPAVRRLRRFGELLADIRAEVRDRNGRWIAIGSIREVGPLAPEVEVIPIPAHLLRNEGDGSIEVRLRMTQGYWKLDDVAIVELVERVAARRHLPVGVRAGGAPAPEALRDLRNPERRLVTYPGDAYEVRFELPPGQHEVFLESRGYYYEWIRDDWLAEEDPRRARQLFRNPRRALRWLAPAYKRIESTAEEVFWRSRVR